MESLSLGSSKNYTGKNNGSNNSHDNKCRNINKKNTYKRLTENGEVLIYVKKNDSDKNNGSNDKDNNNNSK